MHIQNKTLFTLLFTVVCWSTTAVFAQNEGKSIAIISTPVDRQSEKAAIDVAEIAKNSYLQSPDYALLTVEHLLAGESNRRDVFKKAKRYQMRANEAYEAFDLNSAALNYSKAIRQYEKHLEELVDFTALKEIFIFQAATYALQGDEKNALDIFHNLLSLEQDIAIDQPGFPEIAKVLFQQAQQEKSEQQLGSLQISSSKTTAAVFLDGRYIGATPVKLEYRPGRHYIQIKAEAYQTVAKTIEIFEGRQEIVQVQLRLKRNGRQYKRALKQAQSEQSNFTPLTKMLKSDQILWLKVKQMGHTVQIKGQLISGVSGKKIRAHNKSFNQNTPRYRNELQDWLFLSFRNDQQDSSNIHTENNKQTTSKNYDDSLIKSKDPAILSNGYLLTGLAAIPAVIAVISGVYAAYLYDSYRNGGYTMAGIFGTKAKGVPDQISAENDQGKLNLTMLGITSILTDVMLVATGVTLSIGLYMISIGMNQKERIEDVLAYDSPLTKYQLALLQSEQDLE